MFDEADNGVINAWSYFFGSGGLRDSDGDLEGDIDSWAIRTGLTGGCGGSVMTTLPALMAPLSQMLIEYYEAIPGTAAGSQRGGDAPCVAQAYGGRIAGGRITSKSYVVDRARPQVADFARNY